MDDIIDDKATSLVEEPVERKSLSDIDVDDIKFTLITPIRIGTSLNFIGGFDRITENPIYTKDISADNDTLTISEQTITDIGGNLSSDGGISSGGTQLYKHTITFEDGVVIYITTTKNTQFQDNEDLATNASLVISIVLTGDSLAGGVESAQGLITNQVITYFAADAETGDINFIVCDYMIADAVDYDIESV